MSRTVLNQNLLSNLTDLNMLAKVLPDITEADLNAIPIGLKMSTIVFILTIFFRIEFLKFKMFLFLKLNTLNASVTNGIILSSVQVRDNF